MWIVVACHPFKPGKLERGCTVWEHEWRILQSCEDAWDPFSDFILANRWLEVPWWSGSSNDWHRSRCLLGTVGFGSAWTIHRVNLLNASSHWRRGSWLWLPCYGNISAVVGSSRLVGSRRVVGGLCYPYWSDAGDHWVLFWRYLVI
jgi:hypothetical protein